MEYNNYLTACAIMDKVDKCEKLIEYVQSLNLSVECTTAIIDMAKYEKDSLLNNFKEV